MSAREAVRCAGLMPPRIRCLGRCDEFSGIEDAFAEAFHFGVTGPSVVRFGAANCEVAPQQSALVACCRLPELPRAVSGCLVPAATFIHVPVIGCFSLVL